MHPARHPQHQATRCSCDGCNKQSQAQGLCIELGARVPKTPNRPRRLLVVSRPRLKLGASQLALQPHDITDVPLQRSSGVDKALLTVVGMMGWPDAAQEKLGHRARKIGFSCCR